jgi:hypothetical protein
MKPRIASRAGAERAQVQVRLPPEQREAWQADADKVAGSPDAPLGPWVRSMVERGRRAK